MERLALLAVTAHPGDELAMAGTLAYLAQAGVHVALACATQADETSIPLTPEDRSRRAAEGEHDLRCVCARLGIADLHFLGYQSSGPHSQAAGAPGTLSRASACNVVRQIVHLVRGIRPQVMVTFGPDGIDRHVDHIATGKLATQAFGAAGDLGQFPLDGGPEPYLPAKLFYFGLPEGLLRLAGLHGLATPVSEMRARRDVSQFVDLKIDAARCYRRGPEEPLLDLLRQPPPERRHLLATEFFTLALPQPAVDDARDPHFFAGIP